MPTFRSNSSAYTTMSVTISEIARSNGYVTYRCYWSVTTGSATSLGASSSNWRNLRIYNAAGTLLADSQIKAASATWAYSSTYSGSFDFAVAVGHPAGTMSVYIRTNADGTQSCIWTEPAYCTAWDISYSLFYTNTGAPTSPAVWPSPFENTLNFSWGAAADGINNAVSTYHLYYRIAGVEYGVNVGNITSWSLDTSALARGSVIDFHIAAISPYSTVWSSWSGTAIKNRVPNVPTSPTVPRTSYIPGEIIVVSFANNGDSDGNCTGFEVATDQSETVVATNASGAATSVSVDTTGWAQGIQRKFRVRSYDALGIRSAWSLYTAMVTLNTTPAAPVINYPAAGATVYNQKPHILTTAAAVSDGPKHILCVNDGTQKTTELNGSAFSCGTNDNLAGSRQVVYLPPANLAVGSASLSALMYDSFLYSSSVARSFTVAALAVTDADLTTAAIKIKAAHVTELQTAVNVLRGGYGLAAAAFTAVTAGVTSIGSTTIITEMQTALQGVLDRINGWDTGSTFDLSVTWVDPAAVGGGVDRVKLRQSIEQIRAIIPTI